MCGVPWYCDVSNTGHQNSVYRRQERKFRRLVEVPKRRNFILLWCRPVSYTTSSSVPDLDQKEHSAGSTTATPQRCCTRMFVTGCHTAWNVRCYWRKLISQKMSPKQISMLNFNFVLPCIIVSVKWNTNLMQHCAGFISAGSLYMFRAQAPIIRNI